MVLVHKSAVGRGSAAAIAVYQAMRCDTGMPSRVIRLSTEQATRVSVFWLGAEATTDDGLVPEHGGFAERASAVADRLLPAQAALVPDHPDVLVALTGRGVSGRARHGRERGDGAGDLIEQRADQGGVTLLDGG